MLGLVDKGATLLFWGILRYWAWRTRKSPYLIVAFRPVEREKVPMPDPPTKSYN
jgi:hypothetical protein